MLRGKFLFAPSNRGKDQGLSRESAGARPIPVSVNAERASAPSCGPGCYLGGDRVRLQA